MPDIDVEAVELTTPPASAPQTSYTPAVLVRNNGVEAVAAYGYLQLFDLDSGLQLKTWILASSSIPAGETKNAYAGASWSPLETDVGKQFVFTGWVTCDGDMVPENNPLAPVVVTVTAEPPPPPPPVTAHASQHEDGGTDELNVDGLSGTLASPQPYADHASEHQDGGDDQLNVGGLSGVLDLPQVPQTHGNERHVQEFALVTELTNHQNDATPHTPALGAPWASKGGKAPSLGSSESLAPAEHDHGGEGCLDIGQKLAISGPGNTTVYDWDIEPGCLQTGDPPVAWERYAVTVYAFADVTEAAGPGATVTFDVLAGPDVGTLAIRQSIVVPIAAAVTSGQMNVRFTFYCWIAQTQGEAEAHYNTTPAGGCVLQPFLNTAAMDRAAPQVWRLRVNLAGTTTMTQVNAIAWLHFADRSGP